MNSEPEITTKREARPTTRRSTQRSNQSTPEHETRPAIQMMKFQPESHSQDPKSGADLGITIRWGVRAGAHRQPKTTTVDHVRGW
jgi:hypothetical protein